MSEMRCKCCGANENRIDGFCSVECKNYYDLETQIAELKEFIDKLIEIGDRLVFPDGVFDDEQSVVEHDWRLLTTEWKECEE